MSRHPSSSHFARPGGVDLRSSLSWPESAGRHFSQTRHPTLIIHSCHPPPPPVTHLLFFKTHNLCNLIGLVEWTSEAACLGMGQPIAISATAGEGLVDLYQQLQPIVDEAAEKLQAEAEQLQESTRQMKEAAGQLQARRWAAAASVGGLGLAANGSSERASTSYSAGAGSSSSSGTEAHILQQQQQQGAQQWGKGSQGKRSGWHASHHLSSDELAQLSALREAEGALDSDDDSDEADLAGDLGPDPDLGVISVSEDGSITSSLVGGRGAAARGGVGRGGKDAAAGGREMEEGEGGSEGGAAGPLPEGPLRVALMGAPNAGKSTLLNNLLGWDRALTGASRQGTFSWGLVRAPLWQSASKLCIFV